MKLNSFRSKLIILIGLGALVAFLFPLNKIEASFTAASTPYIWVPYLGGILQIKTSDGSFVSKFVNSIYGYDCTADCDTNTPTWTMRVAGDGFNLCPNNAFLFVTPPSILPLAQVAVAPDGDIWVGGKGSLTRLGKKAGCIGDQCYECKNTHTDLTGHISVTFDREGNLWAGYRYASSAPGNDICKYKPDGTKDFCLQNIITEKCSPWHLMSDCYGNIWLATALGFYDRVCRIEIENCDTTSCPVIDPGWSYHNIESIDLDNQGDVWIANNAFQEVSKVDGSDSDAGTIGDRDTTYSVPVVGDRAAILAVDGNNNIWVGSDTSSKIYVLKPDGTSIGNITCGTAGLASLSIDAQNNGWVVNARSGHICKIGAIGGPSELKVTKKIQFASLAHEDSDMTGFRTTVGVNCSPPPSCTWQNDDCGIAPCLSTQMHQTCGGPPGCSGGCTRGDTRCVVANPDCAALPSICDGEYLTTFSDDSESKMVTLPAGGGEKEAGKISLPQDSYVCSAELTFDKTVGPGITIGTPFIWVPLSGVNKLTQIRTSDGKVIRTFSNDSDNCGSSAFNNPSRITVFPGGDVWVANRGDGSVTRLGLKAGCTGDDCYECKGTYSDIGGGPRGVTFDASGDIWVGAYTNDRICKYKRDGTLIKCASSTCKTYGMIGDSKGNVWISDRANGKLCKCSSDISCSGIPLTTDAYGIGMDNEGHIWVVKNASSGEFCEYTDVLNCGYFTRAGGGWGKARGIAVDGKGYVWVAASSDGTIRVFKHDGTPECTKNVGGGPIGIAIDADNNGWIVEQGGEVDVLGAIGGPSSCEHLSFSPISVGDSPYNYSDMTGFRTIALNLTISDFSTPISRFPQVISGTSLSDSLTETLSTCDCQGCTLSGESFCGNPFCEIPISVSSIFFSGNYSLSNLKICYREGPSKITGGLVPCGRQCDDPNTAIREDAPCTLCHFFVLAKRTIDFLFKSLILPLTLLMLVIAGVKFIGASGSPEKISEAKTIALAAILGFIIAFSAWLVINSALSFIVQGKAPALPEVAKIFGQPWDKIECPVP